MNEEYNFPIKYAVLELVEDGGYINNYEKVIKGYIATKCYVLEDVIKYKSNGTNYELYRVFFPNKNLEAFESDENRDLKHEKLSVDLYGNLRGVDTVYALYDTYEEAKQVMESLDEQYRSSAIVLESRK